MPSSAPASFEHVDDDDPHSPPASQTRRTPAPQPINASARTTRSQPSNPVASSFRNSFRLSAIVSGSLASPTRSADGPPSSRLRSSRTGSNEPEYSLVELEARLSRDASQPVELYFHREWEPRPAAIEFRAGTIRRLSRPDNISAAPCVRIEPPVHLFSVQDEIGHPDSPVTRNEDDNDGDDNDSPVIQGDGDGDDDGRATQGDNDNDDNVSKIRDDENITNNQGNTATRSFLGLSFVVLGLLGVAALPILLGALVSHWALLPSPVPVSIHQPIVQLATTLAPLESTALSVLEMRATYAGKVRGVYHIPNDWVKPCRDEVPGPGQPWAREIWSSADNDKNRRMFHGADKMMTCSMAMKSEVIAKCLMEIKTNLYNITLMSTPWLASELNNFTTHLMVDLEILESVSVQPTSSRLVAITQPVILAYLKAFDEKMKQESLGYVPRLASGYLRGPVRRNVWAYEAEATTFVSFRNATEILSDLCDCLDRLSQMLQLLEKTTAAFGEELTPLLIFIENLDSFVPAELEDLYNTDPIRQMRHTLDSFNERMKASLSQLVALQNALNQMAWLAGYDLLPPFLGSSHHRAPEPARKTEWQGGLDFWSSIWVVAGVMEHGQAEAQGVYNNRPPLSFWHLALLSKLVYPRFPVVVPSLRTQIDGLQEAHLIYRKIYERSYHKYWWSATEHGWVAH
ncbi:hypothetical protein QQX98_009711 [Neonectria punicea]|uniref:Uncharacterized protein n=1 Tax=Neonectria punicea TaxID=979145 RepID=A0ABR1GRH8_9HYPO